MNATQVFLAEIAVSLATSAFILARLQRLLRRIGSEVCERGGAATEFWIAYTQLMMLIAPLLLVAWFSRAGEIYIVSDQLKSSVSVVLWGQFIGLALVGRAVWKTLVAPPRPAPEKPVPHVVAVPAAAEAA